MLFDHLVDISEKQPASERLAEVANSKNDYVKELVIAIVNELESFDGHPTSEELYLIVHESIKKIKIPNLPNISGDGLLIPPPLQVNHLANF
ncbi:MAG: hypothetical protein AB8G05_13785 [Oligoflexales bacterium]